METVLRVRMRASGPGRASKSMSCSRSVKRLPNMHFPSTVRGDQVPASENQQLNQLDLAFWLRASRMHTKKTHHNHGVVRHRQRLFVNFFEKAYHSKPCGPRVGGVSCKQPPQSLTNHKDRGSKQVWSPVITSLVLP